MQYYCTAPRSAPPTEFHAKVMDDLDYKNEIICQAAADCQASPRRLPIALTEWNLLTHATQFNPRGFVEPMDALHALFAASMIHNFVRLVPALELANVYQLLVAMGVFVMERGLVRPTLQAEVFRLYRDVLPAKRVDLAVESPLIGQTARALDGVALAGEQGIQLFLVNRALDCHAGVELGGFGAVRSAQTRQAACIDAVTMERIQPELRGNRLVLPPLSITCLDF